jgi:hypothetical protein
MEDNILEFAELLNIGVIATTILLIATIGLYVYAIKHNPKHEK